MAANESREPVTDARAIRGSGDRSRSRSRERDGSKSSYSTIKPEQNDHFHVAIMARSSNPAAVRKMKELVDLGLDAHLIVDQDPSEPTRSNRVDSETHNLTDRVHFIADSVIRPAGFTDINSRMLAKKTTAWERALYWTWFERPEWDFTWFVEDDVWWAQPADFLGFIRQYSVGEGAPDYIAQKIAENEGEVPAWPHWSAGYGLLPKQHYGAAFSVLCRLSRRMLIDIATFAKKRQTLVFLELFFPTIAKMRGMAITWYGNEASPLHLRFRPAFCDEELEDCLRRSDARIFHPVKHEPRLQT